MPVPWMAIAAAFNAAKAGYDIYSGVTGKKESTRRLGKVTGSYMQKSPEETKFLEMLRRRMEKGALPIRAMMRDVSADIGEHGGEARQRALGFAASRGLENTGVAASLAGKADANTMQAIARAARAIAIQNEMTKAGAQDQYGQYGMGRSDLMRQAAMLQYQGGEDISNIAQQRISQGIGGFGQAAGAMAGQPEAPVFTKNPQGEVYGWNARLGRWIKWGGELPPNAQWVNY